MLHAVYTYKSTLGLFRYGQYLLFLTGIINLIFDVILGRIWGTFGIYLATMLARAMTNLWYEPYAVYRFGLKKSPVLYVKRYLIFAVILFFTGGVCYLICGFCHFPIIENLIVKILICSIVPNAAFYLCFRRTNEFEYLSGKIKHILKKVIFRRE